MQLILSTAFHHTFRKKGPICLGSVLTARQVCDLPFALSRPDHTLIGNTLSILPIVIPPLVKEPSYESLHSAFEHTRQENMTLIDKHHFDVEQYFSIQADECIYDMVLFFDNLKNNDYQDNIHNYIDALEPFEQVHYPLTIIFNDYDVPSLGIEFCKEQINKEQAHALLQEILATFDTVARIVNRSCHALHNDKRN